MALGTQPGQRPFLGGSGARVALRIGLPRGPYPQIAIYHLAIEHSHGKSPINGAFTGKTIYFYGPFSMAMLNNQRVNRNDFHEPVMANLILK